VELWYGDADTIVPVEMGRFLGETIPDAHLEVEPGGGHTLFLTRWSEILRRLVAAGAVGSATTYDADRWGSTSTWPSS
jgi:pimeloyl-ACP methyl ester carboxylesterase